MQKGQHEYAVRKAHELFDAWNDVAGVVHKFSGYYYEILSVIEDAVRVGSMVALGIKFAIEDGEIKQHVTDAETKSSDDIAINDCEWVLEDNKYEPVWQTSCGNSFKFYRGDLNLNEFIYCPYCGRMIPKSSDGPLPAPRPVPPETKRSLLK